MPKSSAGESEPGKTSVRSSGARASGSHASETAPALPSPRRQDRGLAHLLRHRESRGKGPHSGPGGCLRECGSERGLYCALVRGSTSARTAASGAPSPSGAPRTGCGNAAARGDACDRGRRESGPQSEECVSGLRECLVEAPDDERAAEECCAARGRKRPQKTAEFVRREGGLGRCPVARRRVEGTLSADRRPAAPVMGVQSKTAQKTPSTCARSCTVRVLPAPGGPCVTARAPKAPCMRGVSASAEGLAPVAVPLRELRDGNPYHGLIPAMRSRTDA
jgi:hypothetical protein